MNNVPRDSADIAGQREYLRNELGVKLGELDARQLDLVLQFIAQIVLCHDPDAIRDFLEWRNDPEIGSILQIASSVPPEVREQLLFAAEELYSTEVSRH